MEICGGLITAYQHGVWAARSSIRVCKSCKKTETDEQRRTAQLMMELMGDSQLMPMANRRAPAPSARFTTRRGSREEKVELENLNVLRSQKRSGGYVAGKRYFDLSWDQRRGFATLTPPP